MSLGIRVLVIGALVALYVMKPIFGIAGLASVVVYGVAQRTWSRDQLQ